YGVTGFTVQYWDGSTWTVVSGGTISGNNLVWRKVNFAAVTTTKIRVLANAAVDGVARIAEVEAWTAPGGAASVHWLVTDQLGTPRMVFDQSGSLATTSRHDYLPFGEDLAGVGGRTATLGYTGVDSARQKFTGYESDTETGLNFAQARYQSPTQGRFTSPDPYVIFFEMKRGRDAEEEQEMLLEYLMEPQNWAKYNYGLNNPL